MIPTDDSKTREQVTWMRSILAYRHIERVADGPTFEVYRNGRVKVTLLWDRDDVFDPVSAHVEGPIGTAGGTQVAYNARGLALLLETQP